MQGTDNLHFTDECSAERFPVAMAYVRIQDIERMYPPQIAFERGTLFPDLDKPFCGRTVTRSKC